MLRLRTRRGMRALKSRKFWLPGGARQQRKLSFS
jgi:hypothetical protein